MHVRPCFWIALTAAWTLLAMPSVLQAMPTRGGNAAPGAAFYDGTDMIENILIDNILMNRMGELPRPLGLRLLQALDRRHEFGQSGLVILEACITLMKQEPTNQNQEMDQGLLKQFVPVMAKEYGERDGEDYLEIFGLEDPGLQAHQLGGDGNGDDDWDFDPSFWEESAPTE